jgi:hypothetical protein
MILVIVGLFLVCLVLCYIVYAQTKKYDKLLSYTELYMQLIGAIAVRTKATYEEMQNIDRLGAFQADDEVGIIFNEINANVTDLNEFIGKYVNATTEEESTKE